MSTRQIKLKSLFVGLARIKLWLFLIPPRTLSVFFFRKFIDGDGERNKLAATKFLIEANRCYSTKFSFLLPRFLKFALELGDIRLPRSFTLKLTESLKQTQKNPALRPAKCHEMLAYTNSLQRELASSQGWRFVSLALSGFGFIRAGTIARNYCLASAISEVESGNFSYRTLHLAIRGLLESRKFNEAKILVDSHRENLNLTNKNNSYLNYLRLLRQDTNLPSGRHLNEKIFSDEALTSLIREKEVAIVAPGMIEQNYGLEIDSADIVYRIKYFGKNSIPPEEYVGTRCDIAFHNFGFLELSTNRGLDTLVTAPNSKKLKLIISEESNLNDFYQIPVFNIHKLPPTFLTPSTSGTRAIFNALSAKPKKIKLFGFDFYTKREVYSRELRQLYLHSNAPDGDNPKLFSWDGESMSRRMIARANISHDLKSDFLLVKNLYELSGLIDGTPEVLAILKLTTEEYDLSLETMLGDW